MRRDYHNASFLTAVARIEQLPEDKGAEVAFAGRSNSGKSSAINVICQQKSLARTSKTPGRTQTINFFRLDSNTRLVDLPGYGYATAPERVRRHWHKLIEYYLARRQSLRGLILVMDIRHPLSRFDWQMLDWSQFQGLPVHVLLTKADKQKRGQAMQSVHTVTHVLDHDCVGVQAFSAVKRVGVNEVLEVLDRWLYGNQ